MNGSVATIRELNSDEIALVAGAWTWGGLFSAMGTGAITGGMGATVTGIGIPAGAIGGGLLAGAGYLIHDMLRYYF